MWRGRTSILEASVLAGVLACSDPERGMVTRDPGEGLTRRRGDSLRVALAQADSVRRDSLARLLRRFAETVLPSAPPFLEGTVTARGADWILVESEAGGAGARRVHGRLAHTTIVGHASTGVRVALPPDSLAVGQRVRIWAASRFFWPVDPVSVTLRAVAVDSASPTRRERRPAAPQSRPPANDASGPTGGASDLGGPPEVPVLVRTAEGVALAERRPHPADSIFFGPDPDDVETDRAGPADHANGCPDESAGQ